MEKYIRPWAGDVSFINDMQLLLKEYLNISKEWQHDPFNNSFHFWLRQLFGILEYAERQLQYEPDFVNLIGTMIEAIVRYVFIYYLPNDVAKIFFAICNSRLTALYKKDSFTDYDEWVFHCFKQRNEFIVKQKSRKETSFSL